MKLNIPLALGAAALPAVLGAQQCPNIIYIMTDQQSAIAMSCAGHPDVHTPNMDRLAEKGVRFTNAYTAMPLSGPARAAMFTGYMPSESGVLENNQALPDSLCHNTLGSLVMDAGYDCVYAGKWHVPTISIPEGEFGFRNIKDNGDIGLAEACVDYLQNRKKKPFFLVASFTNPHNICEFARGQKTPYAPVPEVTVDECPNLPANFAVNPYDASVLQFEKSQNYALYPTSTYTPDDWRQFRYAYFRLVEAVDAEIGKIVDEIDRQNLWKNTVIIFSSDHGDGHGAHQWNQKTALYEEVTNVPFIVCSPDVKEAGSISNALINSCTDLMPSICEWTGATMPAGRGGVSFRDVVENGSEGVDYIVTETNFLQTSGTLGWMVRSAKYKYVLYDKGQHREMLYDMENDRGEMCNLAIEAQYREIVKEHRAVLENWVRTRSYDATRHLRFIPE